MDEGAFLAFLTESDLMEVWGSPLLFPKDAFEIEIRTVKNEYDVLAVQLHLRRRRLLEELEADLPDEGMRDFYQARLLEEISSSFATLLQNTRDALLDLKAKHQR
mmetsp:Transcript_21788/g.33856  ORF Transcript_21788/g.33856 Transcript_21788/m.33856 type:complete len:105 (-) Transcript_21788:65-379(-)|eukprot:CAMPEP_0201521780 /NCGR_PEP_ID=MMETSP0161_2-20130828/16241_1 /ASSEMBLY_ACC=CAM_ASM_000251 /TAXON_ID=180227 /ORGANISM="Neoparamoeba aestuarina, Strain SoJaBio B1-5/56/2" /LENGTH=104 /DNA_ID=CAMNT_0047920489 /DNA_START=36 /DNA_END=350 /DNA_ORIENTATION=+